MYESRFWRLQPTSSTSRLAKWNDEEMDLEQVVCSVDEGHQRAGRRLTPISVEIPKGKVENFVWTWYSECLIDNKVLISFRDQGFSGFEVRPVQAKFARGIDAPPKLWEFLVTGWAGLAPPESGVKRIEYCNTCQHARYSDVTDPNMLIDDANWDGSDFFIVWPMPRFIFVTDRVARFLRSQKFSGFELCRSNELQKANGVIAGLSPGRLSYWMSDDRAVKIGRASGIDEV